MWREISQSREKGHYKHGGGFKIIVAPLFGGWRSSRANGRLPVRVCHCASPFPELISYAIPQRFSRSRLRSHRGVFDPCPGGRAVLKVDYPASTAPGELQIAVTYTLWIPDGGDNAARNHCPSARGGDHGIEGGLDGGVRPALAGAGQEVGLRVAGAELPRAQ